jgi:hypothetical protein
MMPQFRIACILLQTRHHPGVYPEHCQLNLLKYEIRAQLMENSASPLGFPNSWFRDE